MHAPHPTCIVLSTIDRKIQENEFPHQLYVQNYSSKGGASDSCILLKKWIFSRTHEVPASTDSVVQNLFYHQVSLHTTCAGWGRAHIVPRIVYSVTTLTSVGHGG